MTIPVEEIQALIDKSYQVTASQKTKKAIRPPKEWIIPSNPQYFDIVHAFDNAKETTWEQGAGIKKGDTVFLYVGAPVSASVTTQSTDFVQKSVDFLDFRPVFCLTFHLITSSPCLQMKGHRLTIVVTPTQRKAGAEESPLEIERQDVYNLKS